MVYKKEEVRQPSGTSYVYKPDIIDFIPITTEDENGNEIITGVQELSDETDSDVDQQCALATIWQRGLDPVEPDDGIQWSEAFLGEISPVQLMQQLTDAVAEVTPSVTVTFNTVTDSTTGASYLTYTLQGVA